MGRKKNTFVTILAIVSLTLAFIFTTIVVYKAINLRKNVDMYKNKESKLEKKLENKIKFEYQEIPNYNYSGVETLISCLESPLKEEDFSIELKTISQNLESLFNESDYNFAFKYKDIFTGFTFSYNSSQPIFTASTIKAPEAIYIYKEAEKGNINLEDTITYTSNYYSGGTGILKNTPFNQEYTIRQLVSYSIIHSDNAAHLMLNNKYKSSNMYNYWKTLGTSYIFKSNSAWGSLNANDGVIYMEELYNFYKENNTYSEELLSYFKDAWKVITVPNKDIVVANKSGWSNYALHDAALIFDSNPYILVVLSNRGYTDYVVFFNNVSTLIYDFHTEYWKTKYNVCNYTINE